MPALRPLLWGTLAISLFLTLGCAWLPHDLQPHRLRRLNRGPGPTYDPEFSAVEMHSTTGELVWDGKDHETDAVWSFVGWDNSTWR